jgi:[protein-PII] uridylyltransferase
LADTRAAIRAHFEETGDGLRAAQAYASFADEMLRGLHRLATEIAYPVANPTRGEALQVMAIGGYGRGLLAPFSDIDLMILLPYKRTGRAEQVVEFILYVLWDLGLKVGHAVRSVDECVRLAKTDMVIRTSLLDMRPLAGDETLADDLVKRLGRDVLAGGNRAFIAAKLGEREQRLEKNGDSRYRLEPNVKESKGGLRDLHLMYWLSAHLWRSADPQQWVKRHVFLPAEAKRFHKAEAFLWAVRTHLHYLVGRAEERLTFEVQREIAQRLGYTDRTGALEVIISWWRAMSANLGVFFYRQSKPRWAASENSSASLRRSKASPCGRINYRSQMKNISSAHRWN